MTRPIGKLERLAYERAEADEENGPRRGLYFDDAKAERGVEFFRRYLRHIKGKWARSAFVLEPWQEFIVRQVFGWYREDGLRRYRTAYVEVPRKNGKSTIGAGIGLYLTMADGEEGAEVYSAATKREQARIVFDTARLMLSRSPLSAHADIQKHVINVPRTASVMAPVSSEASTLDGLNAHGIVIDELHAHRTREVYDVLETSMGAREQPLIVSITTAGVYAPESIGWQMHDLAVKVLEGSLEDDSLFAFITAMDADDDWQDESVWAKANPNFGKSVGIEYLREKARKARAQPSFQNTFRRLHLNEWTQQAVRWLDMEDWLAGAEPLRALEGRACYAGLDLASNIDLTAFVLLFPDDDGSVDVLPFFWCPEERILERAHNDRVPYDAWARDGHLIATPGNIVDTGAVRAVIRDLGETYDIRQVNYDRWGMSTLGPQLAEDGFLMVPLSQGFTAMNAPTREVERLVIGRMLRHAGHPVLTWMASNVTLSEQSTGYVRPDKAASIERIDGIVALIMGAAGMMGGVEDNPWAGDGPGVHT